MQFLELHLLCPSLSTVFPISRAPLLLHALIIFTPLWLHPLFTLPRNMADQQDTTTTSEAQISGGASGAGSAALSGGLGGSASKKSSTTKKAPKLGQKTPQKQVEQALDEPEAATANGVVESDGEIVAEPLPEKKPSKRRQSRGRGKSQYQDSGTESVIRSDLESTGGRRQRNRGKRQQQQGGGLGGLGSAGGPLGAVNEVGETVSGATDLVQNTAGQAVSGVGKAAGGLLGSGKKGDDGGKNEQLRLRLDLNLDVEIQLKAKIHGDLTLGLL
jgi:hypothetical protein